MTNFGGNGGTIMNDINPAKLPFSVSLIPILNILISLAVVSLIGFVCGKIYFKIKLKKVLSRTASLNNFKVLA